MDSAELVFNFTQSKMAPTKNFKVHQKVVRVEADTVHAPKGQRTGAWSRMVLPARSEANSHQGQRTDPAKGFAPPISSVPEPWTATTFYVSENKCNSSHFTSYQNVNFYSTPTSPLTPSVQFDLSSLLLPQISWAPCQPFSSAHQAVYQSHHPHLSRQEREGEGKSPSSHHESNR